MYWKTVFQPSKQTNFTKNIYGFDIETYDNNRKFYCASLYGKNLKKVFFDKRKIIEYLKLPMFHNSCICATNLQFDFFGTFYDEPEEKEAEAVARILFQHGLTHGDDSEPQQLPAEFTLLLMSDGIIELPPPGELPGKQQTLHSALARSDSSLDSVSRSLGLDRIETLPDDVTLLMIHGHGHE